MLKPGSAILMTFALLAAPGGLFAQSRPPTESSKTPGTPQFRQYEPKDKSYQMAYPADWKVMAGGPAQAAATFYNPKSAQQGNATEFVNLTILPTKNDSLEKLIKVLREQMAAKAGLTVIEDGAFKVGEWNAHRFVNDFKMPNGVTARTIQFVMVKEPSFYVITYHMLPENYNKETQDLAFQMCGLFKAGAAQPLTAKAAATNDFESKELGISLSYPSTWTEAPVAQKGVALALTRSASAGKAPQIIVLMADRFDDGAQVDMKELESRLLKIAKAGFKNATVTEEIDTKLAGEPARRLIVSGANVQDDHPGSMLILVCIRGRSTFGMMASGPAEDFEGIKADVEKITASYKFAEPAAESKTAASAAPPANPPVVETKSPAPAAPAVVAVVARPGAAPTPPVKAQPPAAPASTVFDSPALGIKFSYPGTWTAHKSADASIALMLLSTPARPGAPLNTILLTTEAVPPGTRTNMKVQTDIALGGAKASLSDAKVIQASDVKVGTERAKQMVIGGHATVSKKDMKSIYLVFQHGAQILTLTGQSTAEDFATLKEVFDGMVSSMELAVPAPKNAQ